MLKMPRTRQPGATLVEYIMILAFVVLGCMAGAKLMGTSIVGKMDGNSQSIGKAMNSN